MSTTDDPVVLFTKTEFEELMSALAEAAAHGALKAAKIAGVIVLEQYAESLERAEIRTASPSVRDGAEAALQVAAAEARRLADSIRDRDN